MPDFLERLKGALAGQYEIERELGRGGSATVYLAKDLKHPRKVAIKVLKPELAAVVGFERFQSEIEITSGFNHPHILTLLDSGEADGFLYLFRGRVSSRQAQTREAASARRCSEDCRRGGGGSPIRPLPKCSSS